MLPDFSEAGDLPVGVHGASLSEAMQRFGRGSLRRGLVADRLQRVYTLARGTGHLARFVIFGSFVTATASPNDVDVLMLMDDRFDAASVRGEAAILLDHAAAQAYFGATIFWLRRGAVLGDEEAAIEESQIKRDGTRRGIVEVSHD